MTDFTHVHLPLVSDYLRVLSTWQDSLANIYYLSVITGKYKSAQQELLMSIFNSSAVTRDQCTSRVALAQHAIFKFSQGTKHL